jgi:hypothetical protein
MKGATQNCWLIIYLPVDIGGWGYTKNSLQTLNKGFQFFRSLIAKVH